MFIALQHHYLCAPVERDVLWRVPLHTALYGAGWIRNASAINMLLMRSKNTVTASV